MLSLALSLFALLLTLFLLFRIRYIQARHDALMDGYKKLTEEAMRTMKDAQLDLRTMGDVGLTRVPKEAAPIEWTVPSDTCTHTFKEDNPFTCSKCGMTAREIALRGVTRARR